MNRQRARLQSLLLVIAVIFLILPSPARALDGSEVPPLEEFIWQVTNGEADELRGVYAPEVFAFPVVSQPEGSPAFVSIQPDIVTQFGAASQYDTTGLLAHNYLAGESFSSLNEGQWIYLIYGDGRIETYIIREFMRFQALSPNSVTSNFVDLETGERLSSTQLFFEVFNRPGGVTLQTCINAEGNLSWGRLFILAEPIADEPISMPRGSRFH
ncbi:MAG TPA: hypothetical protein PKK96_09075 [Anaerolineales bacterium]|nr:hypothetical protein [Anaerolineales bacterium]HNQ94888.1 hypothetical protein [Anaerolineales bacterium]HNS61142.1 hypothetical protein [Anaerolineales bacterium]